MIDLKHQKKAQAELAHAMHALDDECTNASTMHSTLCYRNHFAAEALLVTFQMLRSPYLGQLNPAEFRAGCLKLAPQVLDIILAHRGPREEE